MKTRRLFIIPRVCLSHLPRWILFLVSLFISLLLTFFFLSLVFPYRFVRQYLFHRQNHWPYFRSNHCGPIYVSVIHIDNRFRRVWARSRTLLLRMPSTQNLDFVSSYLAFLIMIIKRDFRKIKERFYFNIQIALDRI